MDWSLDPTVPQCTPRSKCVRHSQSSLWGAVAVPMVLYFDAASCPLTAWLEHPGSCYKVYGRKIRWTLFARLQPLCVGKDASAKGAWSQEKHLPQRCFDSMQSPNGSQWDPDLPAGDTVILQTVQSLVALIASLDQKLHPCNQQRRPRAPLWVVSAFALEIPGSVRRSLCMSAGQVWQKVPWFEGATGKLKVFVEPPHLIFQNDHRTKILEHNVIVVDKADWFRIWLRFVLQNQVLPRESGFVIFSQCLEIAVLSLSYTRQKMQRDPNIIWKKLRCDFSWVFALCRIQVTRRSLCGLQLPRLVLSYPCPQSTWHERNVHRQSTGHRVNHISWRSWIKTRRQIPCPRRK